MTKEWIPDFISETRSGNLKSAFDNALSGVTKETIGTWKEKYGNFSSFNHAVELALKTISNGENVFQGYASVALVDRQGNIKAFWSNTDDFPDSEVFARGAFGKAVTRAVLYNGKVDKKTGLFRKRDYLIEHGFKWHDGASTQPIMIENEPYFIGVSGATVNERFNRRVLGSKFEATTEKDPHWRAAGYWDRFLANRVRTLMKNEFTPNEIGPKKMSRRQSSSDFMN